MHGLSLNLGMRSAATLVDLSLRYTRELNALLLEIEHLDRAEDTQTAKQIVGKIMGEIYTAALYPIFEKYPDLKPPGFP